MIQFFDILIKTRDYSTVMYLYDQIKQVEILRCVKHNIRK
jgi:hypothetical protein